MYRVCFAIPGVVYSDPFTTAADAVAYFRRVRGAKNLRYAVISKAGRFRAGVGPDVAAWKWSTFAKT